MNRVVILEGPDGAGKTTLARRLKAELGFNVRHEGVPPVGVDKLDYYVKIMLRALRERRPVVFDRFHLGETVYGPVMRNVDGLSYTGRILFDRLAASHGIVLRICLPSFTTCLKNWREKLKAGNDYVRSRARFEDVYWRFKALTSYYETYDPFGRNAERQWTDLSRAITTPLRKVTPGLIGSPKARFLIVGERASRYDLPFFSLHRSSAYLNCALRDAGFEEHDMAFVNVLDVGGMPRNMTTTIKALPRLKVIVALGNTAFVNCQTYSRTYRPWVKRIPHPAFWKRFHHHEKLSYVDQLRVARRLVS